MENKNDILLAKSATVFKLTASNAKFEMKNRFLSLTVNDNGEEKTYDRVFLHRAFPHDMLWEYISVIEEESREVGIIYNIEDFDADTVKILKTELERKYYSPTIVKINSLKERYGFSYWKVETEDKREISITMKDTYGNIIHTSDDAITLVDVDGNRFHIDSISNLDRKSYHRIELYL